MTTDASSTQQGHYVVANGLEIYYEEYGSGEPLLLLHGGTLTSHSWQAHAPLFAQHFRVIVPDSRGHGRTRNPTGELSFRLMAADLAAFVAALGLNKPWLCGFSDGAQIALECGMYYPTLTRGFVLAGQGYKSSETIYKVLQEWGIEGPGVINLPKVQKNMAGLLEMWRTEHAPLGGPEYWQTLLVSVSKMWWTPFHYTATDLTKITEPILFVIGDRDQLVPVEEAVELYRFIPQAELAILPNASHGETVYGASGVNPIFMSIVLDFLLRHKAQSESLES